jgi:uncharacterized membrane protein YkvI
MWSISFMLFSCIFVTYFCAFHSEVPSWLHFLFPADTARESPFYTHVHIILIIIIFMFTIIIIITLGRNSMNSKMLYLPFWACVILFIMMISSFIHFPANNIISFFFRVNNTALSIYTTFPLFVHQMMDMEPDSTTWLMWIVPCKPWLCRSLLCVALHSFGYMPKSNLVMR